MKKVLIACECSQVETLAFRQLGAEAFSCDIKRCMGGHPEWHIRCDVRQLLDEKWDLIVAHPPCTMLARVSAVQLAAGVHTMDDVEKAREFFMMFLDIDCPVAVENPIPLKVARLPRPSQWICPSDFGHPYTKKTGLWLKDLPPLFPTHGHYIGVGSWIKKVGGNQCKRSRSFEGIAEAMASQWLPII